MYFNFIDLIYNNNIIDIRIMVNPKMLIFIDIIYKMLHNIILIEDLTNTFVYALDEKYFIILIL